MITGNFTNVARFWNISMRPIYMKDIFVKRRRSYFLRTVKYFP
jgi:hypothetical protein